MKRKYIFYFFFIFSLFSQALSAQTAGLPFLNSQIGIAAAVRGTVKISNQTQVGQVVSSGQAIHLGDEVSTDSEGNLQILLLDQTTFTIGPNSAIVIDKFVYDPATHDGEIKAKVVKGVFRFVTGKIGQKKPQQMEVDLPSGTIGIRGTIVGGEVAEKKSTVVLLGPGENNNTGHRQGSFDLQNGGNSETVNKTGFASTIEGDGFPSQPFQMPQADLDRISNALAVNLPPDSDQDSQGGQGNQPGDQSGPLGPPEARKSPTEQSGQGRQMGRAFGRQAIFVGRILQKLNAESNQASQKSLEESGQIFNGPTSRNQLQALASALGGGIQHFEKQNVILSKGNNSNGQNGVANFYIDINFGSREIGGGNSRVEGTLSVTTDFKYSIDDSRTLSFGEGSDNAGFIFFNIPKVTPYSNCADCAFANIEVGINNKDGIIAADARVGIIIKPTNAPVDGNNPAESFGAAIAPRM